MKILHVGPLKPKGAAGGPSHSVRGLAGAQAKLGLSVGLISSLPVPAGVPVEKPPGVHLFQSLRKTHYNPWLLPRQWISRIESEFGTPDVVNFHSFYTPFQCALARRCRQLGWPYLITPRGELSSYAQNIRRTKKRIANLLCFGSYIKHAAAIHALNTKEAEQIQTLFKPKRIVTVPNGVDESLLEFSENSLPDDLRGFKGDDDLLLGFVGRIYVYHKGLDLLLKALAILKSRPDGPRCKLFLVGPFYTKDDEQSFFSSVESFGVKDCIRLLGGKYGRDRFAYFRACDVFVHTSRFEGMPMAVLEAMALGRPCLVTPGTNMGDVVREGGGWECEPNAEAIAGALKDIYQRRNSFEDLGRRSRELIRQRFTWPRVARQLSEEYAGLCDRG